jgi:hypothetical protein
VAIFVFFFFLGLSQCNFRLKNLTIFSIASNKITQLPVEMSGEFLTGDVVSLVVKIKNRFGFTEELGCLQELAASASS